MRPRNPVSPNAVRRNELEFYAARHQGKLNSGEISYPDSLGSVAICYLYKNTLEDEVLTRQVQTLAERQVLVRGAGRVAVARNPTMTDVIEFLSSPQYSSIILLGHGSVGNVAIGRNKLARNLPWYEAAQYVEYLKTGAFEQRSCGHRAEDNSGVQIPVGTFAVTDQRNISLPLGVVLPNVAGVAEFDAAMVHPFHEALSSAEQLYQRFHKPYINRPVALTRPDTRES